MRSRKGIWCREILLMNFIVESTVFKRLLNCWGTVMQGHLFHSVGCEWYAYIYCPPNLDMNQLAYEGASLEPITVTDHFTCIKLVKQKIPQNSKHKGKG